MFFHKHPGREYGYTLSDANLTIYSEKQQEDLSFVKNVLEDSVELKNVLENQTIGEKEKKEILHELFASRIGKDVLNLLNLMIDANRIYLFENVFDNFQKLLDDHFNILKVEIISAVDLNEEEKKRLEGKLSQKTSKRLQPNYKIDEDLLAGVVIKFEDKVIDSSIRNRFEKMKQNLLK